MGYIPMEATTPVEQLEEERRCRLTVDLGGLRRL